MIFHTKLVAALRVKRFVSIRFGPKRSKYMLPIFIATDIAKTVKVTTVYAALQWWWRLSPLHALWCVFVIPHVFPCISCTQRRLSCWIVIVMIHAVICFSALLKLCIAVNYPVLIELNQGYALVDGNYSKTVLCHLTINTAFAKHWVLETFTPKIYR